MQINILIVDDIEANLISLEALLDTIDENYNIIKANSGHQALELALNEHIDLIILDIQMPDMDGFEVAQFLKLNKITKDIPIIFLTAAFKSKEWVDKGFELGAIDYLIKTIDENRQKDKQIFESSKMASMGEMIGNIAHQWRQPLSVISTSATGMQLQKEYGMLTDEKMNDMLEKINSSAQFLSKTIDDFRDFIKGDLSIAEFNIAELVEKALIIEEAIIIKYAIKIVKNLEQNLMVNNYSNLFLQCLVNIINNSKDILVTLDEANRFIFITAEEINNQAIISIKDSGGGVDKSIMTKIFDAYFTTKHQSQGTGIGLYMTYNMITKMNGTIEVKNETFEYNNSSYTGANFIITLPLK